MNAHDPISGGEPYPIALINMPFASLNRPSIALAQLQSVVRAKFPTQAEASVFYFNFDLAEYLGLEASQAVSESFAAVVSGLGDWFFAKAAFPEAPDATAAYFKRHPAALYDRSRKVEALLKEKRPGIDLFLDELIDRWDLTRYRLIGFTTTFQQNVSSLALARKLKERDPSIVIVMGGANCETAMGAALVRNFAAIDFSFSGPALKSFPQFIGHLMEGDLASCDKIPGVFSKTKLRAGAGASEIGQELSLEVEVPLDYRGYLELVEDWGRRHPNEALHPRLLFETSRGCWWGERSHCTFCGLNGTSMNFRTMPAALALRQFDRLFEESSKVESFAAVDNIMPKEYLEEVFGELRSPKPIFYEVKANMKDSELAILARAGVTRLQPGIESLSSPTLRLMKKGTTAFQNINFLKSCVRHGITPLWGMLVAFPFQEEGCYQKMFDDMPRLHHLMPPLGISPIRFERYSPYFNLAQEYKLELSVPDFYHMIYPIPETELRDLAYFFNDETPEAPYRVLAAKWVAPMAERLGRWRMRWAPKEGRVQPALFSHTRGGVSMIYDSRAEGVLEYELSPQRAQILEALDQALDMNLLGAKLSGVSPEALGSEIGWLRERSLVFVEKDRYLSLLVQPNAIWENKPRDAIPAGEALSA